MTEQQVRLWLDALKSGKYTQVQGTLVKDEWFESIQHCCLGVLSDVCQYKDPDGELDHPRWFDATLERQCDICVALNDKGPLDQYQRVIADIEMALEDYITSVQGTVVRYERI